MRIERSTALTARNLESRIVKLETRTARPDEMLVVWRKPDCDVVEALKGATYAKGDKVICAEWFDDSPLPAPRWHANRPRLSMNAMEDEQLIAQSSAWRNARRQSKSRPATPPPPASRRSG
jgi:hypothetical protein